MLSRLKTSVALRFIPPRSREKKLKIEHTTSAKQYGQAATLILIRIAAVCKLFITLRPNMPLYIADKSG
jgi:hypothetical protein